MVPNMNTNNSINTTDVSPQSEELLAKLSNIGEPLNNQVKIYTGVNPGRVKAFVIDNEKYQDLIQQDPDSKNLFIPYVYSPRKKRWKIESAYILWITSSKHKQWHWSNQDDESIAEELFATTYPAIRQHLFQFKDKLKSRIKGSKGKFYWEVAMWEPKPENYPHIYQPKIIYPLNGNAIRATYDTSNGYILGTYYHIPTEDLSLLAILNSSLMGWYAKQKFRKYENNPNLIFTKENIGSIPIICQSDKELTEHSELIDITNKILIDPENPNVQILENSINEIIYKLYDLTPAEINLIEEETSK
ncbi:hypothetical protein C6497_11195 [Candidatus Poribacteria bacterium]|nr:MAG: hypothetical protein C6497_11195 [Candidatus Poribacteria bacterium]